MHVGLKHTTKCLCLVGAIIIIFFTDVFIPGASKFNVAIEECSGPMMIGDFNSVTIASTPGDGK